MEFAVKIAGVVPEAAAALGLIVSVAAITPGFIDHRLHLNCRNSISTSFTSNVMFRTEPAMTLGLVVLEVAVRIAGVVPVVILLPME